MYFGKSKFGSEWPVLEVIEKGAQEYSIYSNHLRGFLPLITTTGVLKRRVFLTAEEAYQYINLLRPRSLEPEWETS